MSSGRHVVVTRVDEPGPHGRSGPSQNAWIAAGVALLLVLICLVWWWRDADSGGEALTGNVCPDDPITIAVAPSIAQAMTKAIADVTSAPECLEFKVTEASVKDVVESLNDPDADPPALWIPDSPTWRGQLAGAGFGGKVIQEALAQTPVGLASGPAVRAPESWVAALASGRLTMSDPSIDGAAAAALLAPYAERKTTKVTPEQIKQDTVAVAQVFGDREAEGLNQTANLDDIGVTTTKLIPVTEQTYLASRRTNDQISAVTPQTGAPVLTYPLVEVKKLDLNVYGNKVQGNERTARASRAIIGWFGSADGSATLTENGLRPGTGDPISDNVGLRVSKVLPNVPDKTMDEVLRSWRVLTVPSSLLAVFDVSGSMNEVVDGGQTRMQLAVDAALAALDVFPGHARIGLWMFSIDQGGKGVDWRQLAPIRRLDQDVDGRTHADLLREKAPIALRNVRGGTGLYDTTFAAYKLALKRYNPNYFNAVVLLSDGANDDPGSLSMEQLLEGLGRLQDPDKPVRIVAIGISEDADMDALSKVAAATGGQSYQAVDPNDLLLVLAQALLAR